MTQAELDRLLELEAGLDLDQAVEHEIFGNRFSKPWNTNPYSTSIEAAFEVMAKVDHGVHVCGYHTGGFTVEFGDSGEVFHDSLPLAICRAALKTLKVEG